MMLVACCLPKYVPIAYCLYFLSLVVRGVGNAVEVEKSELMNRDSN